MDGRGAPTDIGWPLWTTGRCRGWAAQLPQRAGSAEYPAGDADHDRHHAETDESGKKAQPERRHQCNAGSLGAGNRLLARAVRIRCETASNRPATALPDSPVTTKARASGP